MKTKISDLKYKAYLLHREGQLPSLLYRRIVLLNENDSELYIRKLMFLSENTIRVKGFYKKYKDIEKDVNAYVERELTCSI